MLEDFADRVVLQVIYANGKDPRTAQAIHGKNRAQYDEQRLRRQPQHWGCLLVGRTLVWISLSMETFGSEVACEYTQCLLGCTYSIAASNVNGNQNGLPSIA